MSKISQDFQWGADYSANHRPWDKENETFLEYLCNEFNGPDLGTVWGYGSNGIIVTKADAEEIYGDYACDMWFTIKSVSDLRALKTMFNGADWYLELGEEELEEVLKNLSGDDKKEAIDLIEFLKDSTL